jgi:hypothetical protein
MFTGAPGTGKTNEMVKWALKLYKSNTKLVRKHNRWKKDKWEYPILYSNIPIRLNRSEWSTELKKEHKHHTNHLIKTLLYRDVSC